MVKWDPIGWRRIELGARRLERADLPALAYAVRTAARKPPPREGTPDYCATLADELDSIAPELELR